MATLYPRGKYWYVQYSVHGRQFRKSLGPNEKLARARLGEIQSQIERGKAGFLEPGKHPIQAALTARIDHLKIRRKPRTITRYEAFVRHLLEFFENRGIKLAEDLTPQHGHDYLKWRLEQKASHATINAEFLFLRGALDREADVLPFRRIDPLPKKPVRRPDSLTADEVKKLLAASPEDQRDYWTAFLHTGARKEELTGRQVGGVYAVEGLRWEDVWWDKKLLSLRNHKIDRGREEYEVIKIIPLLPPLRSVLEKRRRLDRPFPAPGPNMLNYWLDKTAKRAEITKHVTVHTLRHTVGNYLASQGISETQIAQILGHRDTRTTQIYTRQRAEQLRGPMSKLDYRKKE